MKNKIFIDTDFIVDLLLDSSPHANAATRIFDLADKKIIKLSNPFKNAS